MGCFIPKPESAPSTPATPYSPDSPQPLDDKPKTSSPLNIPIMSKKSVIPMPSGPDLDIPADLVEPPKKSRTNSNDRTKLRVLRKDRPLLTIPISSSQGKQFPRQMDNLLPDLTASAPLEGFTSDDKLSPIWMDKAGSAFSTVMSSVPVHTP
eukprot:gene14626-4325_t